MLLFFLLFLLRVIALPFSPATLSDDVSVEERAPVRVLTSLADFAVDVAQAVVQWENEDKATRNAFTPAVLDYVNARYPGNNAFIYHKGDDTFRHAVPETALKEDVSIKHAGFLGWFGKRENYEVVLFDGPGRFERHRSDGGYLNWAFYGNWTIDDEKRVVIFGTPFQVS